MILQRRAGSNEDTTTILAVVLLTTQAVQAGPKSPRELAKEHFNKGYAFYQAGQYLKAVRELKLAYSIRPVPLVLYYVGRTYKEAGLTEEALIYFQRFLDEARLTDPRRKEVEGLIKELGGKVRLPGGMATTPSATTPARPTPRPAVTAPRPRPRPRKRVKPGEIIHEVIEEARPNLPLLVEAELPDTIQWARMFVYFRPPGMEQFVKKLMKPGRRGIYSYLIHHGFLRGKSLQYYIEAVGRNGKRIAGSGTATSPNIILLSRDAPMQPGGRMDDSDQTPGGKGTAGPAIPSEGGGKGTEGKHAASWTLYGAAGLSALTVALVASGIALNISARNEAQYIADAGAPREGGGWAYPPSSAFTSTLKKHQDRGKSYQVGALVSYVVAAAAAGGATYLWLKYLGVVGKSAEKAEAPRQALTPVLGKKTVGLSYELTF